MALFTELATLLDTVFTAVFATSATLFAAFLMLSRGAATKELFATEEFPKIPEVLPEEFPELLEPLFPELFEPLFPELFEPLLFKRFP